MSVLVSGKIPQFTCVECGYRPDYADSAYGSALPEPGDVSLCMKCAHVTIFTEDMSVREPTTTELREITNAPHVQKVIAAIKAFRCQRRHEEN